MILPLFHRLLTTLGASLAVVVLGSSAQAFTVAKNVNTGKPPVEKVVIFEKGKPTTNLTLESTDSCKAEFKDGSLESKFVGEGAIKVVLRWKPQGNLPESFDLEKYTYVVLTMRLEGNVKTKQPNGKFSETRGGNLWFPIVMFNAAGENVGSANIADACDDGKTPAQTVTINIPVVLFTLWMHDLKKVSGVGFTWDKTRAGSERDFRLVVDKIALAD